MKYFLLLSTFAFFTRLVTAADLPQANITILATFDYPGDGNDTFTYGINQDDQIAGYYIDSSSVSRGYTRSGDGIFSAPIVVPGAFNVTRATGISHGQTVAGWFEDETGVSHGFFLNDGSYTRYDFLSSDLYYTQIYGLSDGGGAFCGSATYTPANITYAFLNSAGIESIIGIPGRYRQAQANGVNDKGEVVGFYTANFRSYHGFLFHPDRLTTAPLDYPGARSTLPQSINNRSAIVGFYADSMTHAYVEKPGTFISYNYPGALDTRFTGINDNNRIAGFYADRNSVYHGFIAQLN